MDRRAKELAEQLIEVYGPRAVNLDRDVIYDLLADNGLDHDREDIDDVERHIRWLWEE